MRVFALAYQSAAAYSPHLSDHKHLQLSNPYQAASNFPSPLLPEFHAKSQQKLA
jgi:hypothetical protein